MHKQNNKPNVKHTQHQHAGTPAANPERRTAKIGHMPCRIYSTLVQHLLHVRRGPRTETCRVRMHVRCAQQRMLPRCDGTGRVVGGVGAVLPWWPVKAYRPCPKLGEAGLQYTRKGQALNDVLFPSPKQRQYVCCLID